MSGSIKNSSFGIHCKSFNNKFGKSHEISELDSDSRHLQKNLHIKY